MRGSKSPDPLAGFLLAGIGFLLAAAAAAVVDAVAPWSWGGWVALHLALLGGVSQLVLGASQFFVAAFLATRPPDRRLTAAQSTVVYLLTRALSGRPTVLSAVIFAHTCAISCRQPCGQSIACSMYQ